jgi:hypothetical protein
MDSLNQLLPIKTDKELIQGGLLSEAVIHEMLINKNKILAVKRYCEMAARLLVPGSFPIWYLYGVSWCFGGKCSDDKEKGFYKTYDLKGSVEITPVACFSVRHNNNYEHNL